eukprot:906401-Amphidinium_carterae.1
MASQWSEQFGRNLALAGGHHSVGIPSTHEVTASRLTNESARDVLPISNRFCIRAVALHGLHSPRKP